MNRFTRGIAIAAAAALVALASADAVVGWGFSPNGETAVPEGIADPVDIAGGNQFAALVRANGTVVAWGKNDVGQSAVPPDLSNVVKVACGARHCLALKADRTLVAWGDNASGQRTIPAGLSGVVGVAAGDSHSVAVKSNGAVVAWGRNNEGQCTIPASIGVVKAVAAGFRFTIALRSNGTVAGWGENNLGQVNIPAGLAGVVAISAYGHHSLALKGDGTVVGWGSNTSGESTIPAGLTDVVAISNGYLHSAAIKKDGTVVAWGGNTVNQTVVPLDLGPVGKLACGLHYSLVIRPDRPPIPAQELRGTFSARQPLTPIKVIANPSDPDGDPLKYRWDDNGNFLGSTKDIDLQLAVGFHRITQTVIDLWGLTAQSVHQFSVVKGPFSLAFNPTAPVAGKRSVGKITLPLPAPAGGTTLALSAMPLNAVSMPPTVVVPEGQSVATFDIEVLPVDAPTFASILANGSYLSQSAILNISKPSISKVSGPTTMFGGTNADFSAVLNGFAGPSGLKVDLGSTVPTVASTAASVMVQPSQSNATFSVHANPVDIQTFVTVFAKLNGDMRIATFVVAPAVAKELTLAAPEVVGGNPVNGNTLRLQGVAGPSGVAVTFSSSDTAVATVPASATIQSGDNLVAFKVTTFAVATQQTVTISATANGVTKTRDLIVNPPGGV